VYNYSIGSYNRIANKLLVGQPKPKVFAVFENNKLHIGTQSLHRTQQSCRWRLFWRLKHQRIVK
jgi:hypothetical protein